jgi:excisionase family DNA binding protein
MAQGGTGPAGAAAEIAMGFGMAQQMMAQGVFSPAAMPPPIPGSIPPSLPTAAADILTPAQVAQTLGVSEADVLASIEAGDLKGKKIGSQYRVTKAALEEFLAK